MARKITEAKARKVYEDFVAHYRNLGMDTVRAYPTTEQGTGDEVWGSDSPALSRNLEESDTFGIAWESGPWEWIYEDLISDLSRKHGVMIEPMNTWAVGIYPA